MLNKQGFNGHKGETRTEEILSEHFYVSRRSVDIDGADFIVEIPFDTLKEFRDFKEEGVVQAKFFENNNEVKIAKEYVEDEEGVRTNFFALLHTNNEFGNKERYFFTASEIKENFRPRLDANTAKEFYLFSLTKGGNFDKFKNISDDIINRIIEDGIKRTEEYRRQKFIREIEDKFKYPEKRVFDCSNRKLFDNIKGKHIVDKLYETLGVFKDFRRITSSRLIDKISFKESPRTSTFYNYFSLRTNNAEILDFFASIEIGKEVTIKNSAFFKGVKDINHKLNKIVEVLNENLVYNLSHKNESVSIKLSKKIFDCLGSQFGVLDFHKVHSQLFKDCKLSKDLWECMQHAYIYFMFGDFEKAQLLYNEITEKAKQNKEEVIYFFAKYNLRTTAWRNWESKYPDLEIELSKLSVSDEKKVILESISKNILFNDYAKSIDEIYLKIKDYKQRRVVNDTADLINRLYAKLLEYINFTDGNWLVINSSKEFNLLVEKVIESCVISFSMKTGHTNHLNALNDLLIQMAIHHCEPSKLLNFFQRNEVKCIHYKSNSDYFKKCIINFFSQENVNFLYSEICYFENKTKNPDLRRKTEKIFENICILLAYLDIENNIENLLKSISYFIDKLDFNIHDISILAHPLVAKPKLFANEDILHLVNVIVTKKNYFDGYLLTSCLYCLEEKGFTFNSSDGDLINLLISASLKEPRNGLIAVLPILFSNEEKEGYKRLVFESLETKFNHELYYESVVSGCLENPKLFFDSYIELYSSLPKNERIPNFFNTDSPYTGIHEPLRQNLNNLVEVIFVLNDCSLLENTIIKQIKGYHPYYNFILNIDSFNSNDTFDMLWILENQSDIVLNKISKNKQLKIILKDELVKTYHREIVKIYIKYFID